jgi:hypothetical protein
MRVVLGIVALCFVPPFLIFAAVWAVTHGITGYGAALLCYAVFGLCVSSTVKRRDAAGKPDTLVPEHRAAMVHGEPEPVPPSERGYRLSRPRLAGLRSLAPIGEIDQRIVKVSPPVLKAIAGDVIGLVAGFALLLTLIGALAYVGGEVLR